MYTTNLTDAQYESIKNIQKEERKRKYDLQDVWNAIFYIVKTGCQWRMLPNDFPKWQLVYYYFRKWDATGVIEEVHDALHEQIRVSLGKEKSPSLGLMDSQSAKTSSMTEEKGFDGNKKVSGRKRHIMTDTIGLLMGVVVHAANIGEREGAKLLLDKVKGKHPRLTKVLVDQGYTGVDFGQWVESNFGWIIEVVAKVLGLTGFNVLPKRWIVERTFGWFNFQRRLAKDYEFLPTCSEAMIRLSMIRIMLNKMPE